MLRVQGNKIYDENNKVITFKGYNLGNWMLIEPNMMGTPGSENRLRKAMIDYAGQEKVDYFFKKFLDAFLCEDDIRFLSELGCNSVRLPFNYHYFESDAQPFVYDDEGFRLLDRVVELCRKYNIYVILDMHAVPGGQSLDWHCDNYTGEARLFSDPLCQKRHLELWKHIANHYKDEDIVAGYELLNEPVAEDNSQLTALNNIYKNVTRAIREIDKKHIIILEGNYWSKSFEGMDAPFDDNLVYSPHYYTECFSPTNEDPYKSGIYSREILEQQMDVRDEFVRKYNVPCWIGEFGIRNFEPYDIKQNIFKDQIEMFNQRGHSWCIWSFKDLFLRGIVYLNPESPWSKFTEDIIKLKLRYNSDRALAIENPWDLTSIFKNSEDTDFVIPLDDVKSKLERDIRESFSDMLTKTFGKKFALLSLSDIDKLVESFKFENCIIREEWVPMIKSFMRK